MTVVLRDSIQTKPLPIARAIIHIAVTRLVTAKKKFSERPNTFSENSGMGNFGCEIIYSSRYELSPASSNFFLI